MIARFRPNAFVRYLSIAFAVLLISGCAAGAPSVNHEETQESSGGSTIDAPSQAVIPIATGTPASGGEGTTDDSRAGVAALQTTVEASEPTPSPTAEPTREPTPEPTAEPSETPRPEPPEPSDPSVSETYQSGSGERDEIALTFDAGDDRGYAEEILDTLKEYGVLATFGITGEWASENPDLVKRIVDEGHQIINHTWGHDSFTGYSTGEGLTNTEERGESVERTNEAIAEATGGYDTRPYFRPAYGDLDEGALADLASFGYTITVMWSCDSLGWDGLSAAEINQRCTDPAAAGDIILMHVGAASQDAAALPQMIEQLQANGFELVTVEQLLQP